MNVSVQYMYIWSITICLGFAVFAPINQDFMTLLNFEKPTPT